MEENFNIKHNDALELECRGIIRKAPILQVLFLLSSYHYQ